MSSFAIPKYGALYIVQSDILDEATIRLGDSVPRRCVVGKLPHEGSVGEKEPENHNMKSATVQVVESDGTTALSPKSQGTVISETKSDREPESRSQGEIIISRFPSVELTHKKRPMGRLTIGILHWAIGLSSFVIIAIISKLQPGTETRLIWKNFFIVWLVFSCVSAIATTAVKSIYGFVLNIVMAILRGVYHLFLKRCGEMVSSHLVKARGRTKEMAESHKKVSGRGWSDAYHFFMFISEWVFFVLILVMVGQQLVDYGDCTYFNP